MPAILRYVLLLALAWGLCPPLDAQTRTYPETITLTYYGIERPSVVHRPATAGADAPLLIALHEAGSSGVRFARDRRPLTAMAHHLGWVVAFPTGTRCLQSGGSCWDDRDAPDDIALADADDVGYLRALVGDLRERYAIDSASVFVVGFSNGASMAYRLAAEAPDLVAAAAAVGGTVGRTRGRSDYDYAMTPPPTAPVPMLIVRGMDDHVLPYHGGVRESGTFQVLPAEYDANFWAEANGCDLAAVEKTGTSFLLDVTTAAVETHRYRQGCQAVVQLAGVAGVGHAWPSARTDYDASREIVTFFFPYGR